MKRSILVCSLIPVLCISFLWSCKKEKNEPAVYSVEYWIIPMHSSLSKVTYNDKTGSPVVLTEFSAFHNGKLKMNVTSKPFTAKITAEINNQTANPLYYDLYIRVDSTLVIGQGCSADAMTVSSSEVEYLVPQ